MSAPRQVTLSDCATCGAHIPASRAAIMFPREKAITCNDRCANAFMRKRAEAKRPEQSLKCNCLSTKLAPCPVHWEEIEQAIAAEDAAREDTLTDDDEVFSAEGQGVGALVDADTLKPCPQCDRKLCQGCVDRADFPDHNKIPEGFEIVPSEEVLPVSRMLANEAIAQEIDAKINEWRHEGAEVERDRILAWLRTYPTTCECKENGGEACRFSDPMNHNGLADAIEKGEHHE